MKESLPFKIAYESYFIPLIFVSNLVLAQSPKSEKLNVIQKSVFQSKGRQLVLKRYFQTCCPEGVRCSWGN
jgi:hypothetical protein